MKPVEVFKVHHYEIILVTLSWIQIKQSTIHKYKYIPVNDENHEYRSKCNNVNKNYYQTCLKAETHSKSSSSSLKQGLTCLDLQRNFI